MGHFYVITAFCRIVSGKSSYLNTDKQCSDGGDMESINHDKAQLLFTIIGTSCGSQGLCFRKILQSDYRCRDWFGLTSSIMFTWKPTHVSAFRISIINSINAYILNMLLNSLIFTLLTAATFTVMTKGCRLQGCAASTAGEETSYRKPTPLTIC